MWLHMLSWAAHANSLSCLAISDNPVDPLFNNRPLCNQTQCRWATGGSLEYPSLLA